MRVNVIGLGKLGLPLAALYAKAGHVVNGVDQSDQLVSSLNEASFQSPEPGLLPLLDQVREGPWDLTFTTSYGEVAKADATFVVVPTPSREDGSYDIGFAEAAIAAVGKRIASNGRYHEVILVSTVNPGDSLYLRDLLFDASGRTSLTTGFVYSPEFIALGSVLEGMKHPDLVLVGNASTRDYDRYVDLASSVCRDAPFYGTTLMNAELAKIALNSFITMKISFSNMIAEICEGFTGGNAEAVLQIIGADHRVGSACLKPGGPFSGPCFPRDNRALALFASSLGANAAIPEAVDDVNEEVYSRIFNQIVCLIDDESLDRILIMGKYYKPNTTVSDQALGPALYDYSYSFSGVEVELWDPQDGNDRPKYDERTLVVLATPGISEHLVVDQAGWVLDVWGELRDRHNVAKVGRG